LGKPLTAFIVKPNDGSQGEGIYLITNPNDFLSISTKNTWRSYIVQEYIDNPYLIDGLKSDLRIYVVLASLKPLEIYICDEGLVRFATVNYESPDDSNLKQVYMHLTNYSLNKKNESYKFTSEITDNKSHEGITRDQIDSEGQGSKRKLTQVFEKMEKSGIKTKRLRGAIDDLVIKTLFALLPEMKVEHTYEILPASTNNLGPSCFQIFGFDILLTSELKPMLLEVNCNPSLRIDYEIEDSLGSYLFFK
jgi:tubulin polyglutamylase TTLL11